MSFDDRIEYYLELDPSLSYEEAMELALQDDEDERWEDEDLYGDEEDYLEDEDDYLEDFDEEDLDFDDEDDDLCYMAV